MKCAVKAMAETMEMSADLMKAVCSGKFGQDVNTLMLCEGEVKGELPTPSMNLPIDEPINVAICGLKDVCSEAKAEEMFKQIGADLTCTDANLLVGTPHATQVSVATMVLLGVVSYIQ